MAKKRNKTKKKILYFSRIVWVLSFLIMCLLGYFIYDANVLPMKYFMAIVVVLVLLIAIHGLFVVKKKTRTWILILLNILAILFMAVEIFEILKINDTLSFLRHNLGLKYETDVYNIIVNAGSDYNSLEDIVGSTVKAVKDMDDVSLFESKVKEKVDVTLEYEENVVSLLEQVSEDEELIIIVNSGNYDAMLDVDKDFQNKVKVLDTITITVTIEDDGSTVDVTSEPFVVYLSGIDTRTNYLPARSLSDVNIILAVNPETKKILMVHIPRDYYVQIHGTTGLKDKLTHAGTQGGVELSMATIEDLLEIEIPYYVRVNFNAVVNLVDAIGGININSDVNYSFTCWTDSGCSFSPGLNYVGGRCALAFARERYAYETGDRHRGENQEQVIELIIDKVTSSSTLINNYTGILNALDGTFQTNLTTDEITSLVKMQINDMASWSIESFNVDGTGASLPTYSYPNQNLYVMEPNMDTVSKAVEKLNEILETNE